MRHLLLLHHFYLRILFSGLSLLCFSYMILFSQNTIFRDLEATVCTAENTKSQDLFVTNRNFEVQQPLWENSELSLFQHLLINNVTWRYESNKDLTLKHNEYLIGTGMSVVWDNTTRTKVQPYCIYFKAIETWIMQLSSLGLGWRGGKGISMFLFSNGPQLCL